MKTANIWYYLAVAGGLAAGGLMPAGIRCGQEIVAEFTRITLES